MQVSNGSILDVYGDYRSVVQRAFYLLRNRRGVIHPSGAVAFQCGYYMGKLNDCGFVVFIVFLYWCVKRQCIDRNDVTYELCIVFEMSTF